MLPVRVRESREMRVAATKLSPSITTTTISVPMEDQVSYRRIGPTEAEETSQNQWRTQLERIGKSGDWDAWRTAYASSRRSLNQHKLSSGVGTYSNTSVFTGRRLLKNPGVSRTERTQNSRFFRGKCPVTTAGKSITPCSGGYKVRNPNKPGKFPGGPDACTSVVAPLPCGNIAPTLFCLNPPLSCTYLTESLC